MADDRNAVLEQLRAKHDEFRGLIADLPDPAYNEVWLGEWNLSQLLAHMAGWWREMTPAFGRVAKGDRPVPQGVDYSDADSWNAKFSADAIAGSGALTDWDEAFSDYYDAAASLDESLYGTDPEKGRPKIGNRLTAASGIEHFDEHLEQLKQWVSQRG